MDKFGKYIDQLTERKTYLKETKLKLESEESACGAEVEHLSGQKSGLTEQIRNQKVSDCAQLPVISPVIEAVSTIGECC